MRLGACISCRDEHCQKPLPIGVLLAQGEFQSIHSICTVYQDIVLQNGQFLVVVSCLSEWQQDISEFDATEMLVVRVRGL